MCSYVLLRHFGHNTCIHIDVYAIQLGQIYSSESLLNTGIAVIINNISFEPDPALKISLDTREGANIDSGKKISKNVGQWTYILWLTSNEEHILFNHLTFQ